MKMNVESPETFIKNELVLPIEETQANFDQETLFDALEMPLNADNADDQQPAKKRARRNTSKVWDYFTIVEVGPDCRRAVCNQCKKSYAYSTGGKVSGTTHLSRHLTKGTCNVVVDDSNSNNHIEVNKSQRRRRVPPYNAERCRREIAKMIIMHDYPLHIVEHMGFVAFARNLQPCFDIGSFETVEGDCVSIYLQEKYQIQKLIDECMPGRISLALDLWSSASTRYVGYVFMRGQFVDSNWRMHQKLLNVVREPYPDSNHALWSSVSVCLSNWGIDQDSLFSVTVNQRLTDVAADKLRAFLTDGHFLVDNCLARTLRITVHDALLAPCVDKIRGIVEDAELRTRSIVVDDRSQWNTTYEMVRAASELREGFSIMCSDENAPSVEEWKQIETLSTLLKPLYELAILLQTTPATPNMFFHGVWKIMYDLASASEPDDDDPLVNNLKRTIKSNFDSYWESMYYVLSIGVVMDPRFKMKVVEFRFSNLYEPEEAAYYVKTVDDGLHEMFLRYVGTPDCYEDKKDKISDFDVYMMEAASRVEKSELDQYLEESLLPRVYLHDFDVLGWWETNRVKYPTMSRMARDVLSVQVCSVPAGSVFDAAGREMDSYRCSLRAETMEAVICAKEWLQKENTW
ncbi:hypothetical protein CASFOL_041257 [Castilleja foliolosa]|uniref:BED-type domain-containing protein n=1 Tax=Castilleja foliolosa TaxID=1961234 RepID=A0ABD3BEV4_9LAMI